MALKNVTPAKGAPTRAAAKKAAAPTAPRFRSDRPQKRSNGGRGNEMVDNDDVSRVAEQALTPEATENRWSRIPNAIEYLRRYNEYLEVQVRNEKKVLTPQSALRLMDLVKRHKDLISDQIKSPLEKLFDILRFTVVPEVFIDAETTTLTMEGIGRCNIMDDIAVTIIGANDAEKKINRQKFIEWLVTVEKEDIVTETINAQTLAAFARAQLRDKNGLKLPLDLIEVKPVTRAQITRI